MTQAANFIDPALIAQAIAAQGAGGDGRTVLSGDALASVLKQLSGITATPGSTYSQYQDQGQNGGDFVNYYNPGSYTDASGNTLYGLLGPQYQGAYTSQADYQAQLAAKEAQMGLDPSKTYLTSQFDNPTGNGSKDQATGYYTLDANGNAVPVGGSNRYSPGSWVGGGRQAAMNFGTVLTAGALGGAFSGADAGAGGGAAGDALGAGSSSDAAIDGGTNLFASDAAGTASNVGGGALAGGGAAGGAAAGGGAAGGAAGGGAAAGGGSLLGSGGQLINGISNGQLLTTGAGLLGAAAGGAKGSNSATTTQQNTVAPQLAQYVYGQNGNGGLLAATNTNLQNQLANGGLNANQQSGLQSQLNVLNDPAYAASLNQVRSAGQGLLGNQTAGNPFTSGQASLMQSGAQPGALPQGYRPLATQLNPGMSSGLLGSVRPYGK